MTKPKIKPILLSEIRLNVENVEIYEKIALPNSKTASKVYLPAKCTGKQILVMVIK